MQIENGNGSRLPRALSIRRAALLGTAVAGLGAFALFAAPNFAPKVDLGTPAQAQNSASAFSSSRSGRWVSPTSSSG